jgi:calcineurin-like phosphoesterase family protein
MNKLEFLTKEVIEIVGNSDKSHMKAYLKAIKKYEKIEGKKICFYIKPIILINIEL